MTKKKENSHAFAKSDSHTRWRESRYSSQKERLARFASISFRQQPELVSADTLGSFDHDRDLGYPGEFPFTRGVQPSMYRGRLWTMRQFAGFGSPEDTNKRFKYLFNHNYNNWL